MTGAGNAALIAVIAIVPVVALMLTSFVKISVVLSLLRNAIGAPDAPSGLVVTGLSLLLTFFVMAPVAIDMVHAAVETEPSTAPGPQSPAGPRIPAAPATPGTAGSAPGAAGAIPGTAASAPGAAASIPGTAASAPGAQDGSPRAESANGPAALPVPVSPAPPSSPGGGSAGTPVDVDGAIRELVPPPYRGQVDRAERALVPLRGFLARHAAARDRETFAGLAARMGRVVQGDEIWVLAPAFVTTELREAFAIAVLIFVPFLVIDLVVGLGLAALGLVSTSPQAIALPLKLLLFVSVDGWRLLIEGLLRGYA
jgi:type III secretion protein R